MIGNIHTNIANDVFPNGGKLTCLKCSHNETFTAAQAAKYLADGWPKHCGVAMLLETPVADPWVCEVCAQEFSDETDLLAHQFNSPCEKELAETAVSQEVSA